MLLFVFIRTAASLERDWTERCSKFSNYLFLAFYGTSVKIRTSETLRISSLRFDDLHFPANRSTNKNTAKTVPVFGRRTNLEPPSEANRSYNLITSCFDKWRRQMCIVGPPPHLKKVFLLLLCISLLNYRNYIRVFIAMIPISFTTPSYDKSLMRVSINF